MSQLKHFIYTEMHFVSVKVEGIGYLLRSFRSEGMGARDREAMHGVGYALDDLAARGRRLASLMDAASLNDGDILNAEFNPDRKGDGLSQAEALVDRLLEERRAKKAQE